MGVGRLCKLFGKTRHAYYDTLWHREQKTEEEQIIVEMLYALQREIPHQSTRSILQVLGPTFRAHGIKVGRDALNEIRRTHKLLSKRSKKSVKTTNSYHRFRRYKNKIKELVIIRAEQVWVSDITYIRVGEQFNFLSLVTDAYSRMIVGYHLCATLSAEGTLCALRMALSSLSAPAEGLIHHSDRGIQYCCDQYVEELSANAVEISMTEKGDPYENAIAERVNGVLKQNFKLKRIFSSHGEAKEQVAKAIKTYNNLRPHSSVENLTPAEAHQKTGELKRKWKSKKTHFLQNQ